MNKELFIGTNYECKVPIANEINKTLETFNLLQVFQVPAKNGKELALKGKIRCRNKGYNVELPIIIQLPVDYPGSAPSITFPNIPGLKYNFASAVHENGFYDISKILTWTPFRITLYKFLPAAVEYFSKDENYPYQREGVSQLTAEDLRAYESSNTHTTTITREEARFFLEQQSKKQSQQNQPQNLNTTNSLNGNQQNQNALQEQTVQERPRIAPAMPADIPTVEALGMESDEHPENDQHSQEDEESNIYDNHFIMSQINEGQPQLLPHSVIHDFPQHFESIDETSEGNSNEQIEDQQFLPPLPRIDPSITPEILENILYESSKEIINNCNKEINNYREKKRERELAENMLSILNKYEKEISDDIESLTAQLSPTYIPDDFRYIEYESLVQANENTIEEITRAREAGEISDNLAQQLINELFRSTS